MAEIFREDPGAPGYFVSNEGRVRGRSGKLLKASVDGKGYPVFKPSYDDGKQRSRRVHVAVCETFHGPRPAPRCEVRHLNGVSTDNRVSNLSWGTHHQNMTDSVRHGTHLSLRKPGAKITQEQADEMRVLFATEPLLTQAMIGDLYGIAPNQVSSIKKNKSWVRGAGSGNID